MPTTHAMNEVARAPFAPVVLVVPSTVTERRGPGFVQRLKRPAWKVVVVVPPGSAEEANDAFATTMLRLYEYLGKVREPGEASRA